MSSVLLVLLSIFGSNPYLAYMSTATDTMQMLIERESTMRYGYTLSSTNDKKLYTQLIDSFYTFQANGSANGWITNRIFFHPYYAGATYSRQTDMIPVLLRVRNDVPEMFIYSNTIPQYDNSRGLYYYRTFLYTPSQFAKELAEIDSVVNGIIERITPDMSQYEQVLFLHDTLCRITRYGDMSGAYAGSIKGVFLNHRAVCEGWSRAMLMLCQRAGIRCIYVTGAINQTPDAESPTWGSHAWNMVEVDAQWYLLDATTDGALGGVGHRAFLKGQGYFDANYTYLFNGTGTDENLTAYPSLPTLSASDYQPQSTSVSTTQKDRTTSRLYDLLGRPVAVPAGTQAVVSVP